MKNRSASSAPVWFYSPAEVNRRVEVEAYRRPSGLAYFAEAVVAVVAGIAAVAAAGFVVALET